ncbi:MAG: SMP-30/gluconolactonase/LRE family protein [Gammaproteobacteria bacterium]|nr:SMP-30/gluconolactonase/LRE family protein [Gammaproteobacteria bacterium]
MKKILSIAGLLLLAALLYLSLWPVPIDPVAWQAPVDRGLVDPYAPNTLLQAATPIDLGDFEGPEDATLGRDDAVYATTLSGHVVRIKRGKVEPFAFAGGRPLGIEVDADGSLVVANAYSGLQRIGTDGSVTNLYGGDDGDVFANNLAIGPAGTIYFTIASRKFGAKAFRDTMESTLFDVLEHGRHGQLLAYDPATREARIILDELAYANGVAISDGGEFLVVVEMNEYRILKVWLEGPQRGRTEVLLDNLPGFGDNLKAGLNGRFWLGIAAPRKAIVDRLSNRPFLRKMILRLPRFIRPAADVSSHVIAFNADGEILMNMHDPDARYPTLTGVLETQRNLYLTTLYGNVLPVVAKKDL